jgi:hypothetical protein
MNAATQRIGLQRYSTAEFLIALVLLFIGIPFVEHFDRGEIIEVVLMTLVLVSGVLAVGRRQGTLVWAVILVLPAVTGKWLHHGWPKLVPAELSHVAGLVFLAFLIWQFLRFILCAPRVDSEVLCAGISVYLLLGLSWTFAYLLVAGAVPDAFAFTGEPAGSHSLQSANAFYFSFITLSTVGYGDIVPVSPVARMLAAMEAITGTLFVAVLIARLVALHLSEELRSGGQGADPGNNRF